MVERASPAVAIPRSSASTSSSSRRFLGLLTQPDDSDPNPSSSSHLALELDESDVVWSSSAFEFSSSAASSSSSASSASPSPSASFSPSSHLHRPTRPFPPQKFGLSAVLADDEPHLRRPAGRIASPVPVPAGNSPSQADRVTQKGFHMSAPVAVPAWPRRRDRRKVEVEALEEEEDDERRKEEADEEEEEEAEEEEEMLPPHVIVARSHATTFSVFEGVGRTLKGRDLRRVRNAVWQKTGFLDL
ncbi:uncharacterized protein [Typha latifolia]|uniref:uncharacterized protein n=1 Tax=Typha latifolia TaxID=4733 RepID=UPI003C2C2698